MTSTQIGKIQRAVRSRQCDGWLLYDFKGINPIASKTLELNGSVTRTRRWFYWIPKSGLPVKLVHAIEPDCLSEVPGGRLLYGGYLSLDRALSQILKKPKRILMEYSPGAEVPTVSRIDGGTLEMIKSHGVRVLSSADLVQSFEAAVSTRQIKDHLRTARLLRKFVFDAFKLVKKCILARKNIREMDVQKYLAGKMARAGLVFDHPPIVACGKNSAVPHYDPSDRNSKIVPRAVLLVDIWAKNARPGSVYADITWTAFTSGAVPEKYSRVYALVQKARDAAVKFTAAACRDGRKIQGCQVDRVCRKVIEDAGFGKSFTHRTGHSIGTEVHGNGANIDDFETKETRSLIPNTLFSIEPGIYLKEFGIRSEIDVFLGARAARVTTAPIQTEIVPIMA
ncbi:MAG: aminopeptidase P family protein [Elusimicrobia bacterium]|nr:aminopeptidase P family protein [Elusimicrobiota bacterium]